MMNKDRGELRFAVFDILNRNTGINRSADVNYILNEVTRSLGRYFLLTFIGCQLTWWLLIWLTRIGKFHGTYLIALIFLF